MLGTIIFTGNRAIAKSSAGSTFFCAICGETPSQGSASRNRCGAISPAGGRDASRGITGLSTAFAAALKNSVQKSPAAAITIRPGGDSGPGQLAISPFADQTCHLFTSSQLIIRGYRVPRKKACVTIWSRQVSVIPNEHCQTTRHCEGAAGDEATSIGRARSGPRLLPPERRPGGRPSRGRNDSVCTVVRFIQGDDRVGLSTIRKGRRARDAKR